MIETILKVDGMMCGMCESVKGAQSHPYEKKGFLSSLFHK